MDPSLWSIVSNKLSLSRFLTGAGSSPTKSDSFLEADKLLVSFKNAMQTSRLVAGKGELRHPFSKVL
jgi:hypothetical protein